MFPKHFGIDPVNHGPICDISDVHRDADNIVKARVSRMERILQRPYDDEPEVGEYGQPPQPSERVLQTFCGT